MTLQELRYAVAVAEHLHFGKAADACHVSQPTLSAQLRKLEQTLGITLFERTNKSVALTAEGRGVIDQAREVLRQARRLEDLAAASRDPFGAPFRLGVIPTLSPYLLPWLMPALQRRYPDWKLIVREDFTSALVAQLVDHELDALAVALPVEGRDLVSRALFRELFLVAVPATSGLANSPTVSETELANERLLLLTEGHCLREQALSFCSQQGDQSGGSGDFRATSVETLRQMVAAGFGCTLLPALAVRYSPEDPRISVRPFHNNRAARTIGLVWRASYSRTQTLAALERLILEQLPGGLEPLTESGSGSV